MTLAAVPLNEVIYVSSSRYHLLVESRLTLTVPTSLETVVPALLVIEPLTAPVKVEPFVKFSVSVESSPTKISPSRVCSLALSVAMFDAPLQPSSHTLKRTPVPLSLIVTFVKLITALVFVTWKTCPLVLLIVPFVIVKVEVPSAASPDCD